MVREDDSFYELLCYLATSARESMDEPKVYGSFRLIETLGKLIDIIEDREEIEGSYTEIKDKIEDNKDLAFEDEGDFKEVLDEIVLLLLEKPDNNSDKN